MWLTQNAADDAPEPRNRPVAEIIESLGNSVTAPKTTAVTATAVKDVRKAVKDTAQKVSDAAKPKGNPAAGG